MQPKVELTNFRKTYRNAKPRALTVMPRFYFHQRSNGKLAEDRRGRQFGSVDEACTYAIHRTPPPILGKTLRSATNTYLSTEVFDGKRSICVVRATVIIERR